VACAKRLLAAQSWSVEYMGDAIDDARKVDSVWYRRDIITGKFAQIVLQHRVVPLFENPPPGATLKFP
jgi:hypothetical protein